MLGKGWAHIFHFDRAEHWGKEPIYGGAAPCSFKVAAGSQCQFHVYFPLLTSVCLGSLSLHIIKEAAVCCEIKVGAQLCGHLTWSWGGGGRADGLEVPLLPEAPRGK